MVSLRIRTGLSQLRPWQALLTSPVSVEQGRNKSLSPLSAYSALRPA